MSAAHTPGRLVANFFAGVWSITQADEAQWIGIEPAFVGSATPYRGPAPHTVVRMPGDNPRDEADALRLATCWNTCDGAPTEDLVQLGAGGLVALTGLTEQYRQERDLVLAELKFVVGFHDRLSGSDVGRMRVLMDRMLNLQQPAPVPAEAAAIGASLDAQSLEQGEV